MGNGNHQTSLYDDGTLKPASTDPAIPRCWLPNTRSVVSLNHLCHQHHHHHYLHLGLHHCHIDHQNKPHVKQFWEVSWPLTILGGEGTRNCLLIFIVIVAITITTITAIIEMINTTNTITMIQILESGHEDISGV